MDPEFDGSTIEPDRDHDRLNKQLDAVRNALADGKWWTLEQLADTAHAPQPSVSARLRDLRKPKFGGYGIERVYVTGSNGLWKYRMVSGAQPIPLVPMDDAPKPAVPTVDHMKPVDYVCPRAKCGKKVLDLDLSYGKNFPRGRCPTHGRVDAVVKARAYG